LILSRELNFELFTFDKKDFENNPFLERELRDIFKRINKRDNKKSIYDLKFYYLFFYNIYIEKKIFLPIFYLNEVDIEEEEEEEEEIDEENENIAINNNITFNSLYNKYYTEIFNGNNINLEYNTCIYEIESNNRLIERSLENKIKNRVIYYNLLKKYLKCNKITFLIVTELL
jgi:hypothetical protein